MSDGKPGMITWFFGPQTSDGTKHETLEEAKVWQLGLLLNDGKPPHDTVHELCRKLVERSDNAVDILTTTASSRPKARKIHGGRKLRKVKAESLKEAV